MNIQAVAQRTGVPAATLRKWEQRYAVLDPERTAGAHRRYDENDVLRVEWLKARLAEGFRIGEAARLLGSVESGTPLDLDSLVDEIVSASFATDTARVDRALAQAFKLYEPRSAVLEVIEPAMKEIGECWAEGRLTVAQEHHTSELVRGRLRALLEPGRRGPRGTAVLCCVPGERHEIGLLAVGILLQAEGWQIVYLGPDTPTGDAAAVVEELEAPLLCVSATDAGLAHAAQDDLDALAGRRSVRVLRGGSGFGGEAAATAVAKVRRLARV